jgi:predicted nucleotidyltransferase
MTTSLEALARRVAEACAQEAGAVAALVAGSTASGETDEWSDIDVVLFYDEWPGPDRIGAVRDTLGATALRPLAGDPAGDVYLEQFEVDAVACQLVHQTVEAWRSTAKVVLETLDTASPVQKALSGLHAGVILFGSDVIGQLRAEAAYPEPLRAAMVRSSLDIFPLWMMQDSLARRDAELWQREQLVSGLQKVLAMLAGVSSVWFSTFQLKHQSALVASLVEAPADLGARLDAALVAPMPDAALELERLVEESLAIVERRLPDVEVTGLRGLIGRRLAPRPS